MFCLPPAGSSANIYYPWKKKVSANIRIIPIEYSGHGRKINEPLINDPDHLANQIVHDIQHYPTMPFVLFGHSVGGGLIWKVLDILDKSDMIDQLKLIVISSRPESSYIQNMKHKHDLSDEKIIEELKRYNNFPNEILNNHDAFIFFLKVIRNDFYISDQLLNEKIRKTHIPLMTIHGKSDPDIPDRCMMEAWKKHTKNWLGSIELEGDHFYFLNQEVLIQMLEKISEVMERIVKDMNI